MICGPSRRSCTGCTAATGHCAPGTASSIFERLACDRCACACCLLAVLHLSPLQPGRILAVADVSCAACPAGASLVTSLRAAGSGTCFIRAIARADNAARSAPLTIFSSLLLGHAVTWCCGVGTHCTECYPHSRPILQRRKTGSCRGAGPRQAQGRAVPDFQCFRTSVFEPLLDASSTPENSVPPQMNPAILHTWQLPCSYAQAFETQIHSCRPPEQQKFPPALPTPDSIKILQRTYAVTRSQPIRPDTPDPDLNFIMHRPSDSNDEQVHQSCILRYDI